MTAKPALLLNEVFELSGVDEAIELENALVVLDDWEEGEFCLVIVQAGTRDGEGVSLHISDEQFWAIVDWLARFGRTRPADGGTK